MTMKDGKHILWLRNEQNHPVACVAFDLQNGVVKYAVATWNPHDKFVRSLGRNKANGRLRSIRKPAPTLPVPVGTDPRKVVLAAIATGSYGPLAKECAALRLADFSG